LRSGDKWVYEASSSESVDKVNLLQTTSIGSLPNVVLRECQPLECVDHSFQRTPPDGTAYLTSDEGVVFSPAVQFLPVFANPTDIWNSEGTCTTPGVTSCTYTHRGRHLGYETVSVPAGLFIDALKVDFRYTLTLKVPLPTGGSGNVIRTYTDTIWMGKDVGEVKRIITSTVMSLTGGSTTTVTWVNLISGPNAANDSKDLGDEDCCGATAGDPIHLRTGNSYQKHTDYAAPGSALRLERHYNSAMRALVGSSQYELGGMWVADAGRSLAFLSTVSPLKAVLSKASGPRLVYTAPVSPGPWLSDADVTDRLVPTYTSGLGTGVPNGALLYRSNNILEQYDAKGALEAEFNLKGQALRYSRDAADKLLSIEDFAGRRLIINRDAATGRWSSVTLPDGRAVTYRYDTLNRLSDIIYPDATQKTLRYNEPARTAGKDLGFALTSIVDENRQQSAYWNFDAAGRAITSGLGASQDLVRVRFDSAASSSYTDALGINRSVNFAVLSGKTRITGLSSARLELGSANGQARLQQRDSVGNAISSIDFNNFKTCRAFDSRRQELVRISGLAATTTCPGSLVAYTIPTGLPTSAPQRKTTTQWHADWRLPIRTAEPGRIVTLVYNGLPDPTAGGAIASCAPSTAKLPDGKPIVVLCKKHEQATTDANGSLGFAATAQSGMPARVQQWIYNANGQVLREDGPRTDVSDVITHTYYADTTADHRLGDRQSTTDPAGRTTQYTRYNAHGQVLQSVDANGNTHTYTYDLRQRPTSHTVAGQTTTYTYDAAGQLTRITTANGSTLSYTYDSAHRLTAAFDNRGNRVDYTLDATGNRIAENAKDPTGVLRQQLARSMGVLGLVQQVTGAQE
jgi:YD repeat-containing protein